MSSPDKLRTQLETADRTARELLAAGGNPTLAKLLAHLRACRRVLDEANGNGA